MFFTKLGKFLLWSFSGVFLLHFCLLWDSNHTCVRPLHIIPQITNNLDGFFLSVCLCSSDGISLIICLKFTDSFFQWGLNLILAIQWIWGVQSIHNNSFYSCQVCLFSLMKWIYIDFSPRPWSLFLKHSLHWDATECLRYWAVSLVWLH